MTSASLKTCPVIDAWKCRSQLLEGTNAFAPGSATSLRRNSPSRSLMMCSQEAIADLSGLLCDLFFCMLIITRLDMPQAADGVVLISHCL